MYIVNQPVTLISFLVVCPTVIKQFGNLPRHSTLYVEATTPGLLFLAAISIILAILLAIPAVVGGTNNTTI